MTANMDGRKQSVSFKFIKNLELYKTEKPYAFNVDASDFVPEGKETTNIEYEEKQVEVRDMRDCEDALSLEMHSFLFIQHPDSVINSKGTAEFLTRQYCEMMTSLVKEQLGADAAFCYDIRFRKNGLSFDDYVRSPDMTRDLKAPTVHIAHVDHTKLSGFDRMKRHLTQPEIDKYLSGRYRARIVNIWRPLYRKIQDCPLAFCDPRTIDDDDLLAADRVTPEFAFELYDVKFNPKQQWYWLSDQAPEEISMFLQFDSECSQLGRSFNMAPHAAFTSPLAPKDAIPRESVEVRVMAFNLRKGDGLE